MDFWIFDKQASPAAGKFVQPFVSPPPKGSKQGSGQHEVQRARKDEGHCACSCQRAINQLRFFQHSRIWSSPPSHHILLINCSPIARYWATCRRAPRQAIDDVPIAPLFDDECCTSSPLVFSSAASIQTALHRSLTRNSTLFAFCTFYYAQHILTFARPSTIPVKGRSQHREIARPITCIGDKPKQQHRMQLELSTRHHHGSLRPDSSTDGLFEGDSPPSPSPASRTAYPASPKDMPTSSISPSSTASTGSSLRKAERATFNTPAPPPLPTAPMPRTNTDL